jgi:hypothetical protein
MAARKVPCALDHPPARLAWLRTRAMFEVDIDRTPAPDRVKP